MSTDQESISWGELAQFTHEIQVDKFGWCSCEDNEGNENPYVDCPNFNSSAWITKEDLEKLEEYLSSIDICIGFIYNAYSMDMFVTWTGMPDSKEYLPRKILDGHLFVYRLEIGRVMKNVFYNA